MRIQSFDYGFVERNNRPVAVSLDGESNDLGLNAIQSWCFLRNVPLMFGNLVTSTDQHWGLLLLLLQIVNIIFSHCFLVHYLHCIQRIGPALHSWCMCYEGKHNFFKKQKKINAVLVTFYVCICFHLFPKCKKKQKTKKKHCKDMTITYWSLLNVR